MEKNEIRFERIMAALTEAIENIFIAEQEKANITDGGIVPEIEFQLNKDTKLLALVITLALEQQENQ